MDVYIKYNVRILSMSSWDGYGTRDPGGMRQDMA